MGDVNRAKPESVLAQPGGVYLMFSTEFWERFSYYGFLGILVFFLSDAPAAGGMGWSKSDALIFYGNITGLIWIAPTVGGYVADRFIGARNAVVLGCLGIAAANLALASVPFVDAKLKTTMLSAGMALMCIGAGLFKSNASSLLSQLFGPDAPGRAAAFMLFYMGINLGAAAAPLGAGTLAESIGWWAGFLASGIGMIVGVAVFWGLAPSCFSNVRRQVVTGEAKPPIWREPSFRTVVTMMPFAIVFATGLMQYGGLMNLYAQENVDREIMGFTVPATWFLTLNPIFIILLGTPLARFWSRRAGQFKTGLFTWQIAAGLLLMAAAFALIAMAETMRVAQAPVGLLPVFYLLLTAGELCIIPVGLAEIGRIAPEHARGTLMGLWILTLGIGGLLAGRIGALAQDIGNAGAFFILAGSAGIGSLLLAASRSWNRRSSVGTI